MGTELNCQTEKKRIVETKCTICSTEIKLSFGENTSFKQSLKDIDLLDSTTRECPGYHVEIGGWKRYWQLDQAVENAYTEDEKKAFPDIVSYVEVYVRDKMIGSYRRWEQRKKQRIISDLYHVELLPYTELVQFREYNYSNELIKSYQCELRKI